VGSEERRNRPHSACAFLEAGLVAHLEHEKCVFGRMSVEEHLTQLVFHPFSVLNKRSFLWFSPQPRFDVLYSLPGF